jgi:3-isopropylmalate dehydrogenase
MQVSKKIAVLPGDGVGPEVINPAVRVLDAVAHKYGYHFEFTFGSIGADAIEKSGTPLSDATLADCIKSDAVLLGAVGHPKYDIDPTLPVRPEMGLLKIRKELGLFASIRPVATYPSLYHLSPVKSNLLEHVDIVIFRELTGGIYFGEKKHDAEFESASDQAIYTAKEITAIAQVAFEYASKRKRKITLVDKSNILETSRLWRKVVTALAASYPSVELNFMYADNAAMQLIVNPAQFDVILTDNLFGDILSDEASVLSGSLGLLPSASIGTGPALFEPIHGAYSQTAGKDTANPIGTILAAAMMMEYFGFNDAAADIRQAVEWAIQNAFVSKDIDPVNFYFTSTIGELVCDYITGKTDHAVNKGNIQIRKSTII